MVPCRLPNENVPLVWAQSLYYVAGMLREGLVSPSEIDPLGRRFHAVRSRSVSGASDCAG